MELGFGFLVGALAGALAAYIITTIVLISRKVATRGQTRVVNDRPASGPRPETSARRQTDKQVVAPPQAKRSATTMIVENVEARDAQLNKNIQEVKELLLRLADVISSTDDASGKAAKAFNSAKDTIDNLDLTNSGDLVDAQQVLVGEIDRVLKTNAALHTELDKANKGIAEQRRQIEELRVQARIDGLTRIPNRASFDERLKEYISLLDRTNLVFTLLLLDIDYFKRINDTHGHLNGDRILRGIAAKISDSIRVNDFAARYGGEEFAVIFPGSKAEECITVAERVRHDIAKTTFRLDDNNIKMSVSGGLAECKKGMAAEDLIAQADQALYKAKSEGRNRIVSTDGHVTQGTAIHIKPE